MSFMAKSLAAVLPGLLLVCAARGGQQISTSPQDCAAPLYFGLCDPYVPGTIISFSPDQKAIDVVATWPDGPAERSGVCPGDRIIAVNGIPVPGHTFDDMLKQLVSPSPAALDLRVARGKQELDFHFDRARETTLAQLSHEKFMFLRSLMNGLDVGLAPSDETSEEAEEVARFYDGVDRRVGFKFIGGVDAPEGTPEKQIKQLQATRFVGPEHVRWVGATRLALAFDGKSYSAGFDAWLLKDREEVLVHRVLPDSPAYRAGLFPGDQILEVNDHSVSGLKVDQLSDLILKPDQPREMTLKLRRGSSTIDARVETEKIREIQHSTPYQSLGGAPNPKADTPILGLVVLYAESPREAMVEWVDYPSPAFDSGLHIGDRILAVNAVPVGQITRDQFSELLQPKGDSELKLDVLRLGKKVTFQIKAVAYGEAEAKIGRKIAKQGPVPEHCPGG